MNNPNCQEEYKAFQENNQLVLILNSDILLPENDPVRVTSAQLEELDYRKLYEAYSSRGRKSVNDPRVLFKVMAYGYQCGIFSTRKLEEACKYRKEVIRKVTFWEKRKASQENITSERGILLRRNRSIQVEGAFGLLKNDFGFRRFLTTGRKNVRVELFFLALGFNLKKRWMKQEKRRLETHYSEKKAA